MNFPIPANEIERLNALHSLNILDTSPSDEFDAVVRIARDTFGVPIALISLIAAERQWFKAQCGMDVGETPREHAFCNFALTVAKDVMVVEDARLDARFRENPLVTGEPHIRFYAGAPLLLGPGICVGTLCVVDHKPRSFSPEQSRTLQDLAQLVVGHLRLHQANSQLRAQTQDLADRERAVSERDHKLRLAEQMAKVGHWRLDVPSYQLSWSEQVYRIIGLDPASGQPTLEAAVSAYHPADLADVRRSVAQTLATGGSFERHSRLVRPDGQVRYVLSRAACEFNQDGSVAALVGVIQDVTDEHEQQALLAEHTALLEATLDNVEQGIMLVDPEHRIVVANRRTAELLDLPLELLSSRPLFEDVRRYQAERGEFAYAPDPVMQLALQEGFRVPGRVYERTRPNGTVLKITTTPMPGGGAVRTFSDVTESRKAEARLRASEERYRLAARATNDAVYDWDLVSDHLAWNEAMEGLFGYSAAEIDHAIAWWEDRVHPDDRERVLTSLYEAIEGTAANWREEYRFRKADGTYAEVCEHGYLMRDDAGRPVRMVGAVHDQTERRAAERALRESNALLSSALKAGRMMAFDWDLTTGRVTRSETSSEILGFSSGSILQCKERLTPEDRHSYERAIEAAAETGSYEVEYPFQREPGTVAWLREFGQVELNEHGKPARVRGLATDITQRKLAETALGESEARYRLLADHATDVILRNDLSGRRTYVSPACRDILGFEPEELLGTSLLDNVHPEDIQPVRDAFDGLRSGKEDQLKHTYRHRHKTGQWIWLEGSRRLVRDQNGKPAEVVTVARDITKRLQLEEQLRQAQKMEAVGQLTGGIAHDFNNLLTVVIGNTELLAESVSDPAQKAMAAMALEAAERGAELNGQLLTFARRQTLNAEPVLLEEVVQGTIGLLKRTLGEHIEIRTSTRGTGSAALTDKNLLGNAILNLAVNARDAMPTGGTLTVTTGERLSGPYDGNIPIGQPVVFLSVEDTGTGMPPEVLARVFEPFFTTKDVGKGTGLGLSMVYGFAEQSGGHVSIRSTQGEGTCVTILFRAVGQEAGRTDTRDVRTAQGGHEKVLLVEDEPNVRHFVASQLSLLGYVVEAVASGPEALDLLQREEFDLLFTDVVLPKGMSGVRLSEEARRKWPRLKVLLTSGYSEEAFEHHGRPAPGTPLLPKPFKRKQLAEALRNALTP